MGEPIQVSTINSSNQYEFDQLIHLPVHELERLEIFLTGQLNGFREYSEHLDALLEPQVIQPQDRLLQFLAMLFEKLAEQIATFQRARLHAESEARNLARRYLEARVLGEDAIPEHGEVIPEDREEHQEN